MRNKHKLILSFFVLCVVLGIFWFSYLHRFSDQGIYSGKNLENYIDAGEYKGISLELPEDYAQERIREEAWSYVLKNAQVKKYPDFAVEEHYEQNYREHRENAKEYGYESFSKYISERFLCTDEKFMEIMTAYAQSEVKNEMLVYSIAHEENITVTDKELQQYCDNLLQEEKLTAEQFSQLHSMTVEEYAEEKNFRFYILHGKIVDLICENGDIKLK